MTLHLTPKLGSEVQNTGPGVSLHIISMLFTQADPLKALHSLIHSFITHLPSTCSLYATLCRAPDWAPPSLWTASLFLDIIPSIMSPSIPPLRS